MNMKVPTVRFASVVIAALLTVAIASCDHNPFSGSKLTIANYNKISPGMSKSQVEQILGKPTTIDTKEMVIFKKTTYRYEDGKNFAIITFKNDEVDSKDTNLTP